jgi:predicted transcriptional regulator
MELVSDYREDVEEFFNMEDTRLFICDNKIELASSIVTDLFISLSLVSKDGRYYNHEMVSFEKSALSWGQELFNYYMEMSDRVIRI